MAGKTLHLRSSVQGREPVAGNAAGQLPVGSIAINFAAAEPFLSIQDSAGAIRRIAGIKVGATAPSTPTSGESWLDTSVLGKAVFKVYDGTAWQGAGNGVVASTTPPVATAAGDLWVDTSTAGLPSLKTWTGTAWTLVVIDATETSKGVARIATSAEATAGTNNSTFITPAKLKAYVDAYSPLPPDATEVVRGLAQLASLAQAAAGTNNALSVTPAGVKAAILALAPAPAPATETASGVARLATTLEVTTGTDDQTIVTPSKLQAYVAANRSLLTFTGTAPISVSRTGDAVSISFDLVPLATLP